MPSIIDQWLPKITKFNVPNMPQYRKDAYIFMLSKIIKNYESLDLETFNQFNFLKEILVTTNENEIPCPNAIGCSTGSQCSTMYFGEWRFESVVISMELAHHAVLQFYRPLPDRMRLSNDLVHYAANIGREPYVYWKPIRYVKPFNYHGMKLSEIKSYIVTNSTMIPIFLYNIPYLIENKTRIMTEVVNGTAPKGINPFWSEGLDHIPSVRQIIEYMNHYHSDHDHDNCINGEVH